MISIRQLEGSSHAAVEPLCDLLIDAVHGGASVGFLAPLDRARAQAYWRDILAALGPGLQLWAAEDEGRIAGSVQLAPCLRDNGRHRAEIQKLFVLTSHRGRGIASRLMQAAEAHAQALGCSLLVLDTLAGTPAESVYRHLGWQKAGEIPQYAATPDGRLHATAHHFKFIP